MAMRKLTLELFSMLSIFQHVTYSQICQSYVTIRMCYWFCFTTSEIYPLLQISLLNITLCYDEVLGRDVCETLLGFHAFTGCDQTGKFNGHSKSSCWQTFLSSPPDVIKVFQNLGVDLGNQEKDSLVKYAMDLYCKEILAKELPRNCLARPATLVNWDGFYFRNIKESRYGFLLQWKRWKKLSRGHISLLYNGSHHTLLHQIFPIHVTLIENGVMFPRFISQYWPQNYLNLNLLQKSARATAKLEAIVVDADVKRISWFVQRCVWVETVKTL